MGKPHRDYLAETMEALRAKRDKQRHLESCADDLLAAIRQTRDYLRSPQFDPAMRSSYVAILDAALFNATGDDT
jgi:hypothetical protein